MKKKNRKNNVYNIYKDGKKKPSVSILCKL